MGYLLYQRARSLLIFLMSTPLQEVAYSWEFERIMIKTLLKTVIHKKCLLLVFALIVAVSAPLVFYNRQRQEEQQRPRTSFITSILYRLMITFAMRLLIRRFITFQLQFLRSVINMVMLVVPCGCSFHAFFQPNRGAVAQFGILARLICIGAAVREKFDPAAREWGMRRPPYLA